MVVFMGHSFLNSVHSLSVSNISFLVDLHAFGGKHVHVCWKVCLSTFSLCRIHWRIPGRWCFWSPFYSGLCCSSILKDVLFFFEFSKSLFSWLFCISVIMMCLATVFFIFLIWGICWASWLYSFCQIWGIVSPSEKFFVLFFPSQWLQLYVY